MKIVAVVAVAQNLAIGKNGKLPWRYSSDLKFFKQTTVGNAVVMGWNTWTSIGSKPLPNRLNIVLSRTRAIENQPEVLTARRREEILALKKYLNCDLCIIGGARVYETFQNDIERWIVTEIPQIIEDADTFMPEDFLNDFRLEKSETLVDGVQVKFYERAQ